MSARYDAVIVGGGHNGFVAAFYLARGGLRTLVLERREHRGRRVRHRGVRARLPRVARRVRPVDAAGRDLAATSVCASAGCTSTRRGRR